MATNYAVLDLETSVKESYGRLANPFDKDNYIVSLGIRYRNGEEIKTHALDGPVLPEAGWLDDVQVIIGINLKFDLLYLWRNPDLQAFFKRGGRIYDVQYAEYIVTAQQHKWASMDGMSEKYGLETKPDKIKEYWKAGYDTIEIPKQELLDYLHHDLVTTESLFKIVLERAHEQNMTPLIRERMDFLCGTIEMEYNGLKIDVEAAERNEKALREYIDTLYDKLRQYTPDLPEGAEFNWGSGKQLSAYLFGGWFKYKTKEHVHKDGKPQYAKKDEYIPSVDVHGNPVYYKTGAKKGEMKMKKTRVDDLSRPKMRNTTKKVWLDGLTKPRKEWALKEEGYYKTGDDVITELSTRGIAVAEIIAELKKKEKDLSAFYSGGALRYMMDDNVIHHSLNNVQTDTGRLSSSKPNAQQMPRGNTSDVREMIVSHFEGGEVAEVDFSSLEVNIQAWCSRDPSMIQHVNDGLDFHCLRLAAKTGEDYEYVKQKAKVEKDEWYDLQRTKAKSFSFQKAYGAGVKAISKSTGMSQEEVQTFMDNEDKLYPNIAKYNAWVARQVEKNAELSDTYVVGCQARFGWHVSTTGTKCRYGFTEQEAPDFVSETLSFSPTQMKNYSIQGEAGNVVATAVGKLWRHFVSNDNYGNRALLCNTVHDCVWLSLAPGMGDVVLSDVERIMTSIPQYYKEAYKVDVPVVFRVESEIGPNMKDLH